MIIKKICKLCNEEFEFEKKCSNHKTRKYCDKCKKRNHYYGRLTECKLCHSKDNIHTHHILGKQYNERDTWLGLCKKCHRFISSYYSILRGRGFKVVRED